MEHRFEAGLVRMDDLSSLPRWDGEDRKGLKLLVYPDQGLGDDILFGRFFGALKNLEASPVFFARRPLYRLLENSDTGIPLCGSVRDLNLFDAWVPAASLPHITGFDGTPPPPLPLTPPEDSVKRARAMTAPFGREFRIGICWTGNSSYPKNHIRSVTPDAFLPLVKIPGTRFFSLYKGEFISQLEETGMASLITDACSSDRDFADTAALIKEMDLVISTDTAVIHLAAGLGKPVWNLLPFESFWQYGRSADTTPWYPGMKLFRQERLKDWSAPLKRIERELRTLVSNHQSRSLRI